MVRPGADGRRTVLVKDDAWDGSQPEAPNGSRSACVESVLAMGMHQAVSCPECHHTFIADASVEIECPACQVTWLPESLSAAATLVPTEPPENTAPVPYLVMTSPSGARRVFELRQDCTMIGRADDCDIVISDEKASRQHARLELRDGFCTLIDENSANGTFVDKKRISERVLVPGERFRIGSVSFSYRDPNEAFTPYGLAHDEIEAEPTRGLSGWIRSTRSDLVNGWRARKEIARLDHQAVESANRASELENQQEEIVAKLGRQVFEKGHAERFPTTSNALRENRSQREQMSRRQAALNEDKAACDSRIAALQGEHAPAIDRARHAVAEQNEAVERCTADIAQLDAACESKRREVEQLSAEVQRIRSSQQPQDAANMDSLQQRLNGVADGIRSDEDRLNALREDQAEAQRTLETAQHRLDEAEATSKEALAPHEQALDQLGTELGQTASEMNTLEEREQELVKELGRASLEIAWDDSELAGLTADHESTGQEASRLRSSAETDAHQCERLRPVVKRLKMRLLMLGAGGTALVLLIVMGVHLLSGLVQPNKIAFSRVRENVGLVVVYGTYQGPNGVLIDNAQSWGSSFTVTKDGFLLTNRHVTAGLKKVATRIKPGWPRVGPPKLMVCFGSDRSRHHPANLVYESQKFDVAVLKVQHRFPSHFKLASKPEQGQVVYACGFPAPAANFAQQSEQDRIDAIKQQKIRNRQNVTVSDILAAPRFEVSMTRGVISAMPTVSNRRVLQTDVQMHSGNSGGALLTLEEKVVGINTFILLDPRSGAKTGTTYAIEITQLKSELAPYVKLN